jgi:hypothetical protein
MRDARLLFWARAKHRAGLERPHFLGVEPPKKTVRSLQPSIHFYQLESCVLPALGTTQKEKEGTKCQSSISHHR